MKYIELAFLLPRSLRTNNFWRRHVEVRRRIGFTQTCNIVCAKKDNEIYVDRKAGFPIKHGRNTPREQITKFKSGKRPDKQFNEIRFEHFGKCGAPHPPLAALPNLDAGCE